MKTHALQQGSPEWLAYRTNHFNASDAAAMLGVSPHETRAQLLARTYTGLQREFSDYAQTHVIDAGHGAEALARPLAEAILDEELYPITGSEGRLSASFDGLTFDESTVWENKTLNAELRAALAADNAEAPGNIPQHYRVQLEQQLLVSGASQVLFMASEFDANGNLVEERHCTYLPDPKLRQQIIDGWAQFERDLATFKMPTPAPAAPVGRSPNMLPALHIQVSGKVTASNLAEFKGTALAAIRSVNLDLNTDADFADAKKAVKWCGDVESKLAAAKEHALSQTADIDALFKAIDDISTEARRVRIDLGKLVDRRNVEVKQSIVADARRALDEHIADLNAEIAPMRVVDAGADFAGAIKGLHSFDAMRAKLEGVIVAGMIAADASARSIRANVAAFKEIADRFEFLFADLSVLVHKPTEDFKTLVQARVEVHWAAVAAKAAEAERKAQEARAAADAKAKAERDAADLKAREARAEADRQAQAARDAQQAEMAKQAAALAEQKCLADEANRKRAEDEAQRAVNSKPWAEPVYPPSPSPSHTSPTAPPTLKLGMIAERLGFALRADFLADVLGFRPVAIDGAAKLYNESDWPAICARLSEHVQRCAEHNWKAK